MGSNNTDTAGGDPGEVLVTSALKKFGIQSDTCLICGADIWRWYVLRLGPHPRAGRCADCLARCFDPETGELKSV